MNVYGALAEGALGSTFYAEGLVYRVKPNRLGTTGRIFAGETNNAIDPRADA